MALKQWQGRWVLQGDSVKQGRCSTEGRRHSAKSPKEGGRRASGEKIKISTLKKERERRGGRRIEMRCPKERNESKKAGGRWGYPENMGGRQDPV